MTSTTVAVSKSTLNRLAACKPDHVSHDEFISEMLDMMQADKREFEMQLVANQPRE
jgi:hypothetical protein